MTADRLVTVRASTIARATKLVEAYNREWITAALLVRTAAEALGELGDKRRGLVLLQAFEAATDRIPAPDVDIGNPTDNEVIGEWLDRF